MKRFFVLLTLISAGANAANRITPCTSEVVRTATGVKSFEVQLLADDRRGFHTMKIYKNEGARRTELSPVAIYYQAEGNVSKLVSVETRETVMAYRERAAPTREGFLLVRDGGKSLKLSMTCYL